MALLEDISGSALGIGAVGVGAILLGPTLFPVIGRVLRPVVKEAIKGGMVLYDGVSAEISNIVAEANSEMRSPGPGSRKTP